MKFPDTVQITPVTIDPVVNIETRGTPYLSKARVEDETEIMYNAQGLPIKPTKLFLLPGDIDIKLNYYIQIIVYKGVTIVSTDDEYIEKKVKLVSKIGSCKIHHIEVIT